MGWKLKRTLLGIEFDVDIENKWVLHGEFYDRKLRKLWTGREFADRKKSKEFITQALSWLPDRFFIIFFFDGTEDCFVQFCNIGGNIIMDYPMWKGSTTFGKDKELVKVLRSLGLKRRYGNTGNGSEFSPYAYYLSNKRKNKREISAEFGEDYSLAADATLLIAGKIYGIGVTGVFYYYSDRLMLEG